MMPPPHMMAPMGPGGGVGYPPGYPPPPMMPYGMMMMMAPGMAGYPGHPPPPPPPRVVDLGTGPRFCDGVAIDLSPAGGASVRLSLCFMDGGPMPVAAPPATAPQAAAPPPLPPAAPPPPQQQQAKKAAPPAPAPKPVAAKPAAAPKPATVPVEPVTMAAEASGEAMTAVTAAMVSHFNAMGRDEAAAHTAYYASRGVHADEAPPGTDPSTLLPPDSSAPMAKSIINCVAALLRGLRWTLHYYLLGTPSWSW